MPNTKSRKESRRRRLLDRFVASIPQYRQEMTRVANRIRDSLPPVVLEHRLDALERHLDKRLAGVEKRLDDILRRLEKR